MCDSIILIISISIYSLGARGRRGRHGKQSEKILYLTDDLIRAIQHEKQQPVMMSLCFSHE